jgi:hypothetical protein
MSRSNCQSDNEKQKPTEHPNESNLNRSFHIDLTTQATLGHHTPTHLTHGAPTQLARPYLPSINLPTRPLDLDLCQITCLSIPNSPTHHTRDPSPLPSIMWSRRCVRVAWWSPHSSRSPMPPMVRRLLARRLLVLEHHPYTTCVSPSSALLYPYATHASPVPAASPPRPRPLSAGAGASVAAVRYPEHIPSFHKSRQLHAVPGRDDKGNDMLSSLWLRTSTWREK